MHSKALIVIACVAVLAGCQSATVSEPLTTRLSGDDPDTQLEFWHQLADRPVTCNDEAFHGVLLYADGQDHSADYAARVSTMKSRGMLPADFNRPANEAVSRGVLAVALTRTLQIKGGIMMRVTNDSPRYAMREMIFMDLYPPSSTNQTFSGSEFLGIIGRIEDYQRGDAADVPATVLPGEMK